MSGLKTFLFLALVLPMPVLATEDPLVSTFASCAGRFSAELEHAWLMQDERASEFKDRRRQFTDLLEATLAPDRKDHALNLRIDAKVVHAKLLARATFTSDADLSRWAARRAQSEIDYCRGFLLKS